MTDINQTETYLSRVLELDPTLSGGVIFVDKPAGISSFGVVARVRRILSQKVGKRVKVGHTGTLDPFATGLLILVYGKMTKQAQDFTKLDKVYEATFVLGTESSTGDPEGEISTQKAEPEISLKQIKDAIKVNTGKIQQRPPIFSAIKINGQRAYKLARQGKTLDMPSRAIEIYNMELLSWQSPELKIRAHVSSGTYIRSLAVDLAKTIGTVAYTKELRRLSIGKYNLAELQQSGSCLHL